MQAPSRMKTRLLLPLLLLLLTLPPGMAHAGEPLTVGIFPRRDATLTMRMFSPLGDYLQRQLGIPVAVETAADFETFMARLAKGRYDLVHFNQYHYIQDHREHGFIAIAQNEERGDKTIQGALFVKSDSPIQEIRQLRGKRIIFGGGTSAMMSYIVPTYLLRQAGLRKGDYEEVYAISPPNSILAVYFGQADAGGAGEIVPRLKVVTSRVPPGGVTALAVSQPLAHLPWAVHPRMSKELRERIQTLLTGLSASP